MAMVGRRVVGFMMFVEAEVMLVRSTSVDRDGYGMR